MPSDVELDEQYYNHIIRNLKMRGVTLPDIAELVMFLEKDYVHGLDEKLSIHAIKKVLHKREAQNAIMTGIELDVLAEKGLLSSPMQRIMRTDESTYGVDENLAITLSSLYGSVSVTNYGYVDKLKHGILAKLNDKSTGKINVFLDDLVGAIAAAACGWLAHNETKIAEYFANGTLD
ncbi:phosphatidylglycerophosphatase A family protein [Companilactobacillus sp.]|jgi:phosphatidylglycerophosphatase A|uniref:phosphatidylglycerophosphatase A family protein n=1 Tax=Companilactobacillus sp. TaxID=2767905 RepID=UPI0025B7C0DF|nr:phosphatidylglycerophosphatase A [Companilactobacillus sp.]MCH4008910.1 phosphatidylglycerophosphatase A [Companilactobacillus sp.]MCH4050911.1 phosphatidylglycerophosphatase A [Companilactobacillus sp.]MCH4076853.1 phosphatidylglycerophosphatase A [Companilactobacillus sp.]MCH4125428.1 phosphatidylglycerophosphatase A [Companilactobacillus sp.]MCH4131970.1 phosphatidylglycerophosphatase A [Companilactobacillus sp.]